MTKKIEGFSAEYSFLSNFHPCEIEAWGLKFPSVEHAYQAAKVENLEDRVQFQTGTPGQAKRLGQTVPLRSQWNYQKVGIMLELLRLKFSIPELREKLLATGDAYLEETNGWGDTYWGVHRGEGQNHLGQLLMQVRDELR
jgi:ribA/ribD-fused uncharacterized protein